MTKGKLVRSHITRNESHEVVVHLLWSDNQEEVAIFESLGAAIDHVNRMRPGRAKYVKEEVA